MHSQSGMFLVFLVFLLLYIYICIIRERGNAWAHVGELSGTRNTMNTRNISHQGGIAPDCTLGTEWEQWEQSRNKQPGGGTHPKRSQGVWSRPLRPPGFNAGLNGAAWMVCTRVPVSDTATVESATTGGKAMDRQARGRDIEGAAQVAHSKTRVHMERAGHQHGCPGWWEAPSGAIRYDLSNTSDATSLLKAFQLLTFLPVETGRSHPR